MKHQFDKTPFAWGSNNLERKSTIRDQYIASLRKADLGDYKPLLDFVKKNKEQTLSDRKQSIENIRKSNEKSLDKNRDREL